MFYDIVFLILGLALIMAGGNYLTDGAESIAWRFHISPMVIGLTVVAFGSSTPDFVVSFMSTLEGKSQLALGDIVGANIFDLLLVVGIMALIAPVPIDGDMRRKDLPMLAFSGAAIFICGDDRVFDGTADIITRSDGIMLLAWFAVFMFFTLSAAFRKPDPKIPLPDSAGASKPAPKPQPKPQKPLMKIWLACVLIVGGLAALVIGGDWIVDGASGIARKAGLSEAMIGLTVVAFGSSMPDLATSAIAAVKRQPGIALGNVVGACIFNIFFIIGACATCKPLEAGNISAIDFGVLTAAGVALLLFGLWKKHKITRLAGGFLVAAYLFYMAYVIIFNSRP